LAGCRFALLAGRLALLLPLFAALVLGARLLTTVGLRRAGILAFSGRGLVFCLRAFAFGCRWFFGRRERVDFRALRLLTALSRLAAGCAIGLGRLRWLAGRVGLP